MYCVIPIDQTNLDIAFKESYTFHEIVFDYITMYISFGRGFYFKECKLQMLLMYSFKVYYV